MTKLVNGNGKGIGENEVLKARLEKLVGGLSVEAINGLPNVFFFVQEEQSDAAIDFKAFHKEGFRFLQIGRYDGKDLYVARYVGDVSIPTIREKAKKDLQVINQNKAYLDQLLQRYQTGKKRISFSAAGYKKVSK
jgi:hypothetical protein